MNAMRDLQSLIQYVDSLHGQTVDGPEVDLISKSLQDMRDHLEGDVYDAIVKHCEDLEHRQVYTGNGHHLAQRLAKMVFERIKYGEAARR
jgi:hypothetical protein